MSIVPAATGNDKETDKRQPIAVAMPNLQRSEKQIWIWDERMNDEIIEMMKTEGEMTLIQIQSRFPTVSKSTISSSVGRMVDAGVMTRRKLFTDIGHKWLFCLVDRGPFLMGEPDYCYYLRTLPNHSVRIDA